MAIGAIQAFIFALLTILYFDTAMAPDDGPLTPVPGAFTDDSTHYLNKGAVPMADPVDCTSAIKTPVASSAPAWRWAAAPSAPPSVTAWPVARRSPVWPASPRPRAA